MACPDCGESVRVSKSLVRGSDDTVQKGGSMPDECPNCGADLSDEGNGGSHRLRKGI